MMVKCKQFGYQHTSALQMDEDAFDASTITNNSEKCIKCGYASTYNKEDYFFRWYFQFLNNFSRFQQLYGNILDRKKICVKTKSCH